jgi:RNA polymerase sigma factor (sigma-70 family)
MPVLPVEQPMKPSADGRALARDSFHRPPPLPAAIPADRPARPPMPAYDERALSAAALRGDMRAWNALVTRHKHRVVVSLLARGVVIDRAKDIAQDVWLRLIEQQREGKLGHLELPGLAIAQAAFLALDSVRRETNALRHETRADQTEIARVADPRANVEVRLLTEERFARAEAILAGCSPSARKVFHLVYGGEGLSHADVARRLGLSLQRVRQIVCEVRKELRAAVEGAEP